MRALGVIGGLVGLAMIPAVVPAAPMDGSVPMLCSVTTVVECSRNGECERSTSDESQVPPFVRVNVGQRMLTNVDGTRTSPINNVQRVNGRLMLQGTQGDRVWGAVIDEESGRMTSTVGEHDGAIVISGTCIAP